MSTKRVTTESFFMAVMALLAYCIVVAPAQAVLIPPTPDIDCNVQDVTLGGEFADSCYGYFDIKKITDSEGRPGNAFPGKPGNKRDLLNTVSPYDDWEFVYKVDGKNNPGSIINGIEITLLEWSILDEEENIGSWKIGWTDTNGDDPYNLPITLDLAAAFKRGNDIGYFIFEDEELTIDPTMRSGTFDLQITAALSHESLFVRSPGENPDLDPDPDPDPVPVPVPGTLVLLGLGLFSLKMVRRR